MTATKTAFNNEHIHDYPQWLLVGVHDADYDGLVYVLTAIDSPPAKVYPIGTTLREIILDTQMVTSNSALKRVLRQSGIHLVKLGNELPPPSLDTPLKEWGVYEVHIGKRVLEVAVGVESDGN